ncbi:MAG TPA: DsbA family oxidoreductase [Dehalococcoidia bacterium]|jgi:predicted DsbA family dithiol-disulfide isomerase|nr:DsbA family oxidoreductase [Dehalococcoidia bacterium]
MSESWGIGFDGDIDVERHAGIEVDAAPARPGIRLLVVSDYICPWCYIGFTRIEQLRAEFDVELSVGAYELRPGIPPEGIPRSEASKGRVYPPGYLDNLRDLAAASGIEMKRPPIVPNTRKAHEATEFAKEHGKLWEIHRALFHAYFEEERNLGDTDVVCEVAAGIGLDADELRRALEDRRYADEVEQQLAWARAAGVTGVPTVVFNEKFAVVGAQEYAVYSNVASRIASGKLA